MLLALDFQSRADAVGQCLPAAPLDLLSLVVAVGHNEDAPSQVRGSDIDGAERYGPGSITSTSQLLHNARKPALGPRGDVLDDEVGRDDFIDDPQKMVEGEAAARVLAEPFAAAGAGNVGAHEAAAQDVHRGWMADSRDIAEPTHAWEVLREHAPAERVDLALPRDLAKDARLGERGEQTQLQASYPRVQAADTHHLQADVPPRRDIHYL